MEGQYDFVYTQATEKSPMPQEFKDRLKKIREDRGFSQAELATKTGLQPAAISHFETGQRLPSFENLRKLSDALTVGVDYLLGRMDEEKHGTGMEASPRGRQLFRHAEKLSDESLTTLEMMAKALREQEAKRNKP